MNFSKMKMTLACIGALLSAGALQASAGVTGKQLILDISVNGADKTATITSNNSVVNLSLYAYVLDGDANAANTGFNATSIGIIGSNGALKGDLGGMALASTFNVSPGASTGNNADLDGDGDKDLGAVAGGASGWVTASAGTSPAFSPQTSVVDPTLGTTTYTGTYSKYLLGTFTFTGTDVANGVGTVLTVLPRTGSALVKPHKYTVDSTTSTSVQGTSSLLAVSESVVINNTAVDGFTLTPTAANTNLAVGGSVHVGKVGGGYYSEVNQLTANANNGSVTADTAITGGPTFVLVWLTDTDLNNATTISTTLSDLNAVSGGTYSIISSGTEFTNLKNIYGGDMTAIIAFNAGLPLDSAFNWNFSNDHADIVIDRLAIVPEPASFGLIALAGSSLLFRRKRRTV